MAKTRKLIVKLAKMITDNMDVKLGLCDISKRADYKLLDTLVNDDQAEIMLAMGRRKPTTAKELAEKVRFDEEYIQKMLDELADIGVIEYNWHNEDRHKQYTVPVYVVGSVENLVLNDKIFEEHPEVADWFYELGEKPLEMISHMLPPGGAGIGFHVIPVEKAIPKESKSLDIEKISYWLDKYRNQLAIGDCVCRKSMIERGEGCGEIPDLGCISVGDYADYLVETGKSHRATYDEVVALLQRAEDNGYMHQITNGDGGQDIFAICNCSVGNCFAIRCSQQFNNQNASASAYRAVVEKEKCVACGKCEEVCPAGAVRLGQKLCTKEGPVQYAHEPQPYDTKGWSSKNWHKDYRDRNQINCYEGGTAPCKAGCPSHISIQGVLQLYKEGRYLDALKLLRQDNPFPSMCGTSCDKRCEKVCMRNSIDYSMEISDTMAKLADMEEQYKDELIPVKVRNKGENKDYESAVAVVGTGYAELSCAYYLANMSYPVTVFGDEFNINGAEKYVLEKMGVKFAKGTPNKDEFAEIYPDGTGIVKKDPSSQTEEGHEAAITIHRAIHKGNSLTLARDPREFKAFKRREVVIPMEQIKVHECLSCGASYVDPNRCIGCGICTTRCMFDAIHLERSHPEYVNYCSVDEAVMNTVLNGAKRAAHIVIKDIKEKRAAK